MMVILLMLLKVIDHVNNIYIYIMNKYIQYGGGQCSLCGSMGTSKTTCPLNLNAANPNPRKHPKALSSLSV